MTHDATDVAIRFPAEDPQLRIRMHGLCYRMLGSLDEADDVLQEAYLRWRRIDASLVASPEAWLTTACTRLCIDRLRLASRQREQYPGQWLPEPLPEPLIDAENQIEVDETLSFALLLAMEALSPDQRAAFLLHDVFGLTFREVAHAIDVDEATCRQLAARARKQLRVGRARFAPTPAEMRRIGDAFFRALRTGDVELLASVLSDDATLVADGGGLASAYPRPLIGRDRVVRFLARLFRFGREARDFHLSTAWFNGRPGYLMATDGPIESAYHLHVDEGAICAIYVQRNPLKLREWRTS